MIVETYSITESSSNLPYITKSYPHLSPPVITKYSHLIETTVLSIQIGSELTEVSNF